MHDLCTTSDGTTPWCATSVDENKKMKSWDNCSPDCPGSSKSTTPQLDFNFDNAPGNCCRFSGFHSSRNANTSLFSLQPDNEGNAIFKEIQMRNVYEIWRSKTVEIQNGSPKWRSNLKKAKHAES